jgi:predicted metal-binding membrane protein
VGRVRAGARLGRVPGVVVAAIVAAWVLAAFAQAAGSAAGVHHGAPAAAHVSVWGALVLFVLSWQVMVAAMMLPSSLPLVRLYAGATRRLPERGMLMAAFLSGYALVWTGFGTLAFLGDVVVHRVVAAVPALAARPELLPATALAAAGLFQFTALKERCLSRCRHPAQFLLRHYDRGLRAAVHLGLAHGSFCVGCCWALMLLMVGAGMANLWWMAGLTALMVYEKTGRFGEVARPVAGVVLLAWATVVLVQPPWLPPALGG